MSPGGVGPWRPGARVLRALVLATPLGVASLLLLGGATWRDLIAPPSTLSAVVPGDPEIQDRQGRVLTIRYGAGVAAQQVPLHRIPDALVQAFVFAEDRRFYSHPGVDVRARAHALVQNLRAGRVVRGASTITEQVVRMLHPRPRTLWSRWLEGFEALWLERRFGKGEILEFYLNRVPYARRRHGVPQAARAYFGRDLDTLDARERLALAVLVRSPSTLDPESDPAALAPGVRRLAERMRQGGALTAQEYASLRPFALELRSGELEVEAPHFVRHVREHLRRARGQATPGEGEHGPLVTTLDGALQLRIQALLDQRLRLLAPRSATGGAVLVLDHLTGEVLAWVNAGRTEANASVYAIDAVTTPRQPGSTLKPLLYAMALERGWTAATLIEDAPLDRPVGAGVHRYRNYSDVFHGPLRMREALGNSLNTPAIRTIQFVGTGPFLERLRRLGFAHLREGPQHYGEGLALGSGEVTLLELARAYAALARGGRLLDPHWVAPGSAYASERSGPDLDGTAARSRSGGTRVLDAHVAAIVADVLSDPLAREREFGGGLLRMPTQTAVKTGTSSGYHDAWSVGFSDRHTVAVWIGNLDRRPMREVTGASGPAWVLRATFDALRGAYGSAPLWLPRDLVRADVCAHTGKRPGVGCPHVSELFVAGSAPTEVCTASHALEVAAASAHSLEPSTEGAVGAPTVQTSAPAPVGVVGRAPGGLSSPTAGGWQIVQPSPGLHLAVDPYIPDELERFPFELSGTLDPVRVEWWLDDHVLATTGPGIRRYLWQPVRGSHRLHARVWSGAPGEAPLRTPAVRFHVR